MGVEGGGTEGKGSRRTSTSGGLAIRIKMAKAEKEEFWASQPLNLDNWSKDELKAGYLEKTKQLVDMEEILYSHLAKNKAEVGA